MDGGELCLNSEYKISLSGRAERSIRKIAKTDKKLAIEIYHKIELLSKGCFDALDIKSINRKNGKFKIHEIRIFHPNSCRIFYVYFENENNKILVVDSRKKKTQKFNSDYYNDLDKCIENEYQI